MEIKQLHGTVTVVHSNLENGDIAGSECWRPVSMGVVIQPLVAMSKVMVIRRVISIP